MIWILPLAVVLLALLRVKYPEFKRSFTSGLFLLALCTVLQFQNCGGDQSSQVRTTNGTSIAPECSLPQSVTNPLCPQYDPNCIWTASGCIHPDCTQPQAVTYPSCPQYDPRCIWNGTTCIPRN